MKLYLNSLLRGLAFAAVLSVGTAASAQVVKVNTDAAKKEVKSCCKKNAQKACAEGQKVAKGAAEQAAKCKKACEEGKKAACCGAAKAKAAAQQGAKAAQEGAKAVENRAKAVGTKAKAAAQQGAKAVNKAFDATTGATK